MSFENSTISLERIDHGVLPSNDLGRAFRFWSTFMGARIGFHANLNARGLNREVPMIVFFTVANHPGFGLALQDFRLSSIPSRPLEGVVWGFEVAADNLSAAAEHRRAAKCALGAICRLSGIEPDQGIFVRARSRWQHSGALYPQTAVRAGAARGRHPASTHQPCQDRSDRSRSSALLVQ